MSLWELSIKKIIDGHTFNRSAMPGGVDILVHVCQLALAGDPDAVLFLTDFANAYDNIARGHIMQELDAG